MEPITWELFEQQVAACRLCPLWGQIRNKVPGQGDRNAPLMLIGEGPGQVEDEQGRERVYICNVVKCRPPHNRVPTPEEAEACRIHLRMQTWLVKPKVIVLLGATAAKYLLNPEIRITRERGIWTERKGIWMMPTYHPSALLRDESKKRDAWHDLQAVKAKLEEGDAGVSPQTPPGA